MCEQTWFWFWCFRPTWDTRTVSNRPLLDQTGQSGSGLRGHPPNNWCSPCRCPPRCCAASSSPPSSWTSGFQLDLIPTAKWPKPAAAWRPGMESPVRAARAPISWRPTAARSAPEIMLKVKHLPKPKGLVWILSNRKWGVNIWMCFQSSCPERHVSLASCFRPEMQPIRSQRPLLAPSVWLMSAGLSCSPATGDRWHVHQHKELRQKERL